MKLFGKHCTGMLAILAFPGMVTCADITLPPPQTKGGQGIFTLLKSRHSSTPADFPLKNISAQELSSLLWAATGQNRSPRGWTIPLAMNTAPQNLCPGRQRRLPVSLETEQAHPDFRQKHQERDQPAKHRRQITCRAGFRFRKQYQKRICLYHNGSNDPEYLPGSGIHGNRRPICHDDE